MTGVAKIAAGISILLALVLGLAFVLLCMRIGFSVQMKNGAGWIRIQVGVLHQTIKLTQSGKTRKQVKRSRLKAEKPEAVPEEA